MKYEIEKTSRFKKDYKQIVKRNYDIRLLKEVIAILASGEQLPEKYKDHALKASISGCESVIYFPIGC